MVVDIINSDNEFVKSTVTSIEEDTETGTPAGSYLVRA